MLLIPRTARFPQRPVARESFAAGLAKTYFFSFAFFLERQIKIPQNIKSTDNLIWRALWFLVNLCMPPLSTFLLRVFSPNINHSRACCADEIKGGYQLVAVKRWSSMEVGNLEERLVCVAGKALVKTMTPHRAYPH